MIKCDYVDHMGTDLTIVNAARVSFDKESDWVENCSCGEPGNPDCKRECDFTLAEGDTKLIRYLAKHNHWTPFSHTFITMREIVPIFVARQRFKHMVGFTYNEVSRRYVDDTPEFYYPDAWRKRPDASIKQGSSDEIIKDFNRESFHKGSIRIHYDDFIDKAVSLYQDMIDSGVAPEQARMVLPQSMLTSYYVSGSLAAWARAYKLRIDPHSQKEIQELAKQWDEIIAPRFPVAWKELVS